jgi:hypothetical protein
MNRLLKNELFIRKSETIPTANPDQPQLFAPDKPVEPIQNR